ncbi:MAG TPA: ABC transporter ATP-binding protein [Thermodesulfobacteriota bacterium]|nr:ABC transporter ATP-binding protein [Thermodesulfobacteriota bacterium]
MLVIRSEKLTRAFGPIKAVNGIDLGVQKGEIFGLVGPDGAGKTTIMRMLSGILPPTSGDAWVLGHSVAQEPEPLKSRIGYMAQRFALYGDLTVAENLHFYADLYEVPRRERPARMERLLAFSNLSPFQKRLAQDLSGGMKQKLGLACALIHTPEVLLLDEPTNGVDPVSRRDFWRILYDLLREGVTIFVSTAYLDEAERCHRLALIHQGRFLALGAPGEIKQAMRGELFELRCDPKLSAREHLESSPGVRSVGIFGDRLHVLLEGGGDSVPEPESLLSGSGVKVQSWKKIAPTLEDVFIAMIEGRTERPSGLEDRPFEGSRTGVPPRGESL